MLLRMISLPPFPTCSLGCRCLLSSEPRLRRSRSTWLVSARPVCARFNDLMRNPDRSTNSTAPRIPRPWRVCFCASGRRAARGHERGWVGGFELVLERVGARGNVSGDARKPVPAAGARAAPRFKRAPEGPSRDRPTRTRSDDPAPHADSGPGAPARLRPSVHSRRSE